MKNRGKIKTELTTVEKKKLDGNFLEEIQLL